jgi:hypothetical protein
MPATSATCHGDDKLDQQLEPVDSAGGGGDPDGSGEERADDGGDDADATIARSMFAPDRAG